MDDIGCGLIGGAPAPEDGVVLVSFSPFSFPSCRFPVCELPTVAVGRRLGLRWA